MKKGPMVVVLLRRHYPFSTLCFGAVVYLIGLAISYLNNVVQFFFAEYIFVLACVGISFCTSAWVWCFGLLDRILEELKLNFEMSKSEFEKIKITFEKRISNDKVTILLSLPIVVFVSYYFDVVITGRAIIFAKIPQALTTNVVYNVYSLLLFSFCGYIIAATAYMFMSGLVFLNNLTKAPAKIKILQKRRKINIDKFLNLISKITLAWFVGVSLVMGILLTYPNVAIIGFLLAVISMGLAFFFVPQLLFHRSICRAKEKLLETIEADFSSKTNLPMSSECDPQKAMLLCILFEQVEKTSDWPIKMELALQVILSAIIPVLTTIIGQAFK